MDSAEKAIVASIIGVVFVIVTGIIVGNTLGWNEYNEMLTIVGSEMSEEGFEEFMENLKLDDGA